MSNSSTINFGEHHAYRRLIGVALAMSAAKDLDSLLEQILREAKELTRSDGGTVYLKARDRTLKFSVLMNDSLNMYQIAIPDSEINLPDVPLNKANGEMNLSNVAAAAANLGQTIVIDDVYLNESYDFQGTRMFDQMLEYRSCSFLTVSLKNYDDECIGVLQLLNAKTTSGEVTQYDIKQIPLVESLASLASVAIQHRQIVDKSRHNLGAALTDLDEVKEVLRSSERQDPVTGLSNRRSFDEVIDNEWRRSRRQRYDLSLCVIEIDDFDKINLERGPEFANTGRIAVANELGSFFKRPSDFVSCYGEGSFAVVLPYLSQSESLEVIERVRLKVSDRVFVANGERVSITVSAGVATLHASEQDHYEHLLKVATATMAQAQQSGGNLSLGST